MSKGKMKLVTIEVEIPEGCQLGPAFVLTYLEPATCTLHASFRCDPDVSEDSVNLLKMACAKASGAIVAASGDLGINMVCPN